MQMHCFLFCQASHVTHHLQDFFSTDETSHCVPTCLHMVVCVRLCLFVGVCTVLHVCDEYSIQGGVIGGISNKRSSCQKSRQAHRAHSAAEYQRSAAAITAILRAQLFAYGHKRVLMFVFKTRGVLAKAKKWTLIHFFVSLTHSA